MSKQYLKGFDDFGYFLGVTDESAGYAVTGTRTSVEGAVSCAKTDNKTATNIAADDNPSWDIDVDWTDTTLTIVVRQMSLASLCALTGGALSDDDVFEEGNLDSAPTVALTFRGMRKDGGYRGYRYYSCKLTAYEYTLQTKGTSSGQVADVTLTYRCAHRACDGGMRGTKDFTTAAACHTWLASIPAAGEDVNPGLAQFTKLEQISVLPSEPDLQTLYVLTAAVTQGETTYAAGDCLYYDGTAWNKLV